MTARILSIGLVALACGLVLGGDEPGADPAGEPVYADADEIRLLLRIVDDPNSRLEEQNAAFNRLLAIGRPVLPHLEERLRLRAGDRFVDLLRGLAFLPEPPPSAPAAPTEEERAAFGQANPGEVSKYLLEKYLAAKKLADSGQYERAKALAEGILKVEPTCAWRSQLKDLKLLCDAKIAEAGLLKPTVTSRQEVYRTKDRIDVTFRMDNLTPGPVDLDFTGTLSGLSRAPKNAQNFLHAEITITEYTPYGDSQSWVRTQTWEMKQNVTVTPASPWIFPVTLDVSADQARGNRYRTYKIDAEIRPYLVRSLQGEQRARRIAYPPITIGVFPIEEDLEIVRLRGLERLSRALDGVQEGQLAMANDVFLICLLLDEKDKMKAVNLLMNALAHPRASEPDKQLIITCLRHITRLPLENSDEAWLDWWRDREGPANRAPR